jgi:hypothetical protein
MTLDLDKEDLINMICGIIPNINLIPILENQSLGRFSDNYGWCWDKTILESHIELELKDLYYLCKQNSL